LEAANENTIYRAVQGDEAALVSVLERVGVQLHAEVESRIGARYRGLVGADDIVQVTCLEVFLRIRSFVPGGPGSFEAWVRRISENNLRDAIRALERDKRPSPGMRVTAGAMDDSYVSLLERVAGKATTVSRAAARNELKGIVDEALRKLPPDYERALRLYELDGLSAPEVAEQMGRSHGAVRMLLARARECLGEILGSESRFL
jgi:RNA polymerase sigma-70 factor (ECF subfamily)